MGRVEAAIAHGTGSLGGGDLGSIGRTDDGDIIALVGGIGYELCHHTVFFGNHPAGGEWHIPATFGVTHFGAINKRVGTPALGVAFDAPSVDLLLHTCHDGFERSAYLHAQRIATTHHMQGGPRQQGGDGVEVTGTHIAAEAGGFEGNRATTTKRITNHGAMPKAPFAQFLHELYQRLRLGAEVRINRLPRGGIGAADFFGAEAVFEILGIGHLP